MMINFHKIVFFSHHYSYILKSFTVMDENIRLYDSFKGKMIE